METISGNDSFEKRLERLDAIVRQLEDGAVPLEESVALYREGMELSRACREQLDKARTVIRLCTEEGLRPFNAETGPETGAEAGESGELAAAHSKDAPDAPAEEA